MIRNIIVMICMMLLFVSCKKEETYLPNTDPKPYGENVGDSWEDGLKTYNEQTYDRIVVVPAKETYSLKEDELFTCDVINEHVGHGFYMYGVPLIEKWEDGEWVRLCNKDAMDPNGHIQWNYIGIEGNTTEVTSTRVTISTDDVVPKMEPGKYRMVVFTALETRYGEFVVAE